MKKSFILGLSASLRNARSSLGAEDVILDLDKIANRESLDEYLERQGNLHLENYYKAGRDNGVLYDKLYAELRKIGERKGLSNSEVCLVAALWGVKDEGADIGFTPLSN